MARFVNVERITERDKWERYLYNVDNVQRVVPVEGRPGEVWVYAIQGAAVEFPDRLRVTRAQMNAFFPS